MIKIVNNTIINILFDLNRYDDKFKEYVVKVCTLFVKNFSNDNIKSITFGKELNNNNYFINSEYETKKQGVDVTYYGMYNNLKEFMTFLEGCIVGKNNIIKLWRN